MAGIKVNSGFDVGAAIPLDNRTILSSAEMLSIDDNTTPDGLLAVNTDDHLVYVYHKNEIPTETTGRFYKYTTETQLAEMYEPTAEDIGKIVQYIGEDDDTYKKGYFYKGNSKEVDENTVYFWENINVQPSTEIPLATISQAGIVKPDGITIAVQDGTIAITEEFSNSKQDAGDYALKSEIPDVSNFATKTELTDGLSTKQPVGDYATQTELSDGLASKQPVGDYATNTDLTTNYATKTELQEGIDSRQPAGDYATKLELSDGLSAKQDALTEEQLNAVNSGITSEKITQYDGYSTSKANVATTLEGYGITDAYTKEEIDGKIPTKTSQLTNDSKYITETDLTEKDYLTNENANSTYATKTELSNGLSTKQDVGDYALKSEIPDVSNFVTDTELTEGLETKQPAGDYATNTALTSGLATKQDTLIEGQLNAVNSGITAEKVTQYDNYDTEKADVATTLAGYGITDAYTKAEVDGKFGSVFHYKGSVDTFDSLPTDDNKIGDVYNVEDTGSNYAWDGTAWDKLSETVDLSSYLTKDDASSTYATKTELTEGLATKQSVGDYATKTELSDGLNTKQNTLTEGQLAATNSGITVEKVTQYDDYATDKADKSTTLAGYGIEDSYTKTEIDDKLNSSLHYKGSVDTEINLPADDNETGDVYNVSDIDAYFIWDGTAWDKLSETTDLSAYLTKTEANGIYATSTALTEGLATKQNSLTEEQLTAANSGITTEKVAQYDGYAASKADKSTTIAGYGIEDAYTKTEIDGKLEAALHYKGSVDTETSLPVESNAIGDVYQTEDTAIYYLWNGTEWKKLAETDFSAYALKTELPTNVSQLTNDSNFISSDSLPDNITAQGNEFNTGGKLVKLEIDGKLPALDGSNLINLPGGSGTSGDTIPLTNTNGTITNSKLYKGLESTDGIINTLDAYNIAYRIKDVESLATTIQNWLAEKGATTSPAADVELATASNTKASTGQPSVDNYALVYTTTNELKITLNSSSGSGSDSEEVYIASFTDAGGTLSLNPKYNATFRFSSAKALVPSDIIQNFKIIEFADFPHIDGFDKSYIISGKTTEDKKLELQKILTNNTLVSYIDNKYLRLLLNDLTPVYFAFSDDNKLQAFRQKEGNNKSVTNDLIDLTNLLAEPNTHATYTGDFAVDFANNASATSLGGTGNHIAFHAVTSAATNQPGNATNGVMIIKVGLAIYSGIPSGVAIYFANNGIHYTIAATKPWGAGYWTGTWNTLSLATGG